MVLKLYWIESNVFIIGQQIYTNKIKLKTKSDNIKTVDFVEK